MSFHGIDLGLGRMTSRRNASVCSDLIAFYEACADLQDAAYNIGRLLYAYNNLSNISRCVKKYGVTRSLEVLFGDSFSSPYAMESEADAAKKSTVSHLKEAFEKLLNRIVKWWTRTSNMVSRIRDAVKDAKYSSPFTFEGARVKDKAVDEGEADLEIKDIDVKSAKFFEDLVTEYRSAIDKIEVKQAQLKKDINDILSTLGDDSDADLKENKARFEQRITAVITNCRIVINSFMSLCKGVGSPVEDDKEDNDFEATSKSDDNDTETNEDDVTEDTEETTDTNDDTEEAEESENEDNDKDEDESADEDNADEVAEDLDDVEEDTKSESKKEKDTDSEETTEDESAEDKSEKDEESEETSDESEEDDKKSKKNEETTDFLDLFE